MAERKTKTVRINLAALTRVELNELVNRIKQLTSNNDHGEALIVAAKFLGCEKLLERLKDIQRQHMDLGHLPSLLYEERFGIYQNLLAFARSRLSDADYQQLYAAF